MTRSLRKGTALGVVKSPAHESTHPQSITPGPSGIGHWQRFGGSHVTFRLVDRDWAFELSDALRFDHTELRIVCPFIKRRSIDRLLSPRAEGIQVITRFDLRDFAERVTDIDALRALLNAGAAVRGISGLHAKLYLFGSSRAIVASVNLTERGLGSNPELGMATEDADAVASCHGYFDDLWQRAGDDLLSDQLEEWDGRVKRHLASGGRPHAPAGLDDFGADAGFIDQPRVQVPTTFAEAPQAFVKFLGTSNDRAPASTSTKEVVQVSGCHRTLNYPRNKRPRAPKDGAVMFIARLTDEPDIRVFGRAIALEHQPGRDDATDEDIALREWVSDWPHYVRIHPAEFVNGTMGDGVSLHALMDSLGAKSFATTQRNSARGHGNVDPRRAYRQQAAVELSAEGFEWLNERLQDAFDLHGTVAKSLLDGLDWPDSPDFSWDDIDEVLKEVRGRDRSWSNLCKAVLALQGKPHSPFSTSNVESTSKSVVRLMGSRTGLDLVALEERLMALSKARRK